MEICPDDQCNFQCITEIHCHGDDPTYLFVTVVYGIGSDTPDHLSTIKCAMFSSSVHYCASLFGRRGQRQSLVFIGQVQA